MLFFLICIFLMAQCYLKLGFLQPRHQNPFRSHTGWHRLRSARPRKTPTWTLAKCSWHHGDSCWHLAASFKARSSLPAPEHPSHACGPTEMPACGNHIARGAGEPSPEACTNIKPSPCTLSSPFPRVPQLSPEICSFLCCFFFCLAHARHQK